MHMSQRDRSTNGWVVAAGAAIATGLAVRAAVRARRYLDLRERTVLITGGSRGLGLNLARIAAEDGANVAICARDEDELYRARDELRGIVSHPDRVLAVQCDVTVQAQVDELVRGAVGHFGAIDFLVNNAGTIQVGPMEEMTLRDFEAAMALHFSAPLYATLAVLPLMRGRRCGRIVNITSIGGKVPAPHLLPYTASKFALVGLSEGLRAELVKDNVFVTTVVPGLFRSGSARNAFFKGRADEEFAWFATSDVLPGVSMSVRRLARRILRAAQHGQAELIAPVSA